jgi:hypothetical protein
MKVVKAPVSRSLRNVSLRSGVFLILRERRQQVAWLE